MQQFMNGQHAQFEKDTFHRSVFQCHIKEGKKVVFDFIAHGCLKAAAWGTHSTDFISAA